MDFNSIQNFIESSVSTCLNVIPAFFVSKKSLNPFFLIDIIGFYVYNFKDSAHFNPVWNKA